MDNVGSWLTNGYIMLDHWRPFAQGVLTIGPQRVRAVHSQGPYHNGQRRHFSQDRNVGFFTATGSWLVPKTPARHRKLRDVKCDNHHKNQDDTHILTHAHTHTEGWIIALKWSPTSCKHLLSMNQDCFENQRFVSEHLCTKHYRPCCLHLTGVVSFINSEATVLQSLLNRDLCPPIDFVPVVSVPRCTL